MHEPANDLNDDGLAEEAALWVARMQSADATQVDQRDFEDWLNASAAHGQAYEEMQSLWGSMRGIDLELPKQRKRISGKAATATLALLCLIGLSLFFARQSGVVERLQADFYTSVGETKVVTLDDGTQISLNTDSAVQTRYTPAERRVVLLRGEAFFDVAKNPQRPFIVESGTLTAQALGTHYAVRSAGSLLAEEVQVEEGEVRVDAAGETTRLVAGDAVTLDDAGKFIRTKKDVANNTAWRDGKLAFSGQSLGEVLKVLERYRHGRIVVLDDRAAKLSVSGIFDLRQTDQALHILETNLPVTVTHMSSLIVFVRSR
ncbi:FecR family protein [uncultured Agrobacterium sp.]|uniref:FecR family protein n=1 Tax=uncultured Agrobacterium sp. TaxID=157277 RepID=UPI002589498F|nr:FecR family protein [uncultured Agrobacterium sp.]